MVSQNKKWKCACESPQDIFGVGDTVHRITVYLILLIIARSNLIKIFNSTFFLLPGGARFDQLIMKSSKTRLVCYKMHKRTLRVNAILSAD